MRATMARLEALEAELQAELEALEAGLSAGD
jgi:hypothetical protein